jgi:phage host-nuclease inhibitor protein Gam
MASRIKSSTAATLKNRPEFETCIDDIAALQLEIDADVAAHNEAQAKANDTFKAELKAKQERLMQKVAAAEMFANFHRDELLGEKQTGETKHGLFGFRKSPGVLKTLNSRWSMAKVMEALKISGKTACIKITEALDKQAVKREIPEAELSLYGLRMDFPEEFWIEAKRAEEPTAKRLSA